MSISIAALSDSCALAMTVAQVASDFDLAHGAYEQAVNKGSNALSSGIGLLVQNIVGLLKLRNFGFGLMVEEEKEHGAPRLL